MTRIHYYNADIEEELIKELVDRLQSFEDDCNIHLFFSTMGGHITPIKYLLHYLNLNSHRITLYFNDVLWSAGTELLLYYKGKRVLTESLKSIMFHKWDFKRYTLRRDSIPNYDNNIVEQIELMNQEFAKGMLNIGLSEEEVNEYKEGGDVVLYQKDFSRLCL